MKILAGMIVILFSIGFLLVAGEQFNRSAAEREYARAAMVREQSQARSDLLAGALPYVGMVVVVVVGGLIFMGTAAIVLRLEAGRNTGEPAQLRIIERYYIVLPEGAPRRAAWDMLAERRQKVIGGGND